MKRFGGPWGCEGCEETETPVGVACFYCHEAILEGDEGVVMPMLGENGKWRAVAEHRRCLIAQIIPKDLLKALERRRGE